MKGAWYRDEDYENKGKPKAYFIRINGKFISKRTYRGHKSVWSNRSGAKQALQMLIGNGASAEDINPIIQSYIDEGFIEIVEMQYE